MKNGQQKIILKLEKYDVVSFDIFDTLLKRNVQNPTDVFRYIEQKNNLEGFAEKRILAEINARKKKNGNEILLSDIYDELGKIGAEVELEAEAHLLTVNWDMLPVFEW